MFPLVDESKRVKNYNFEHEIPLLIDPAGKLEPREHITFDKGLPVGKTDYGKATIKVCKLDREALNDERKELIENIEARIDILAKKDQYELEKVNKAKKFILDAQQPNAKYSAAAIDFLSRFTIVIKT